MQNSELSAMPMEKASLFKTPSKFTLCAIDEDFDVDQKELNEFIERGQIKPVAQHRYGRVLARNGFTSAQLKKLYLVSLADPRHSVSGTEEWIHRRSLNDANGAQIKGAGLTTNEYEREEKDKLTLPYSLKGTRHVYGGFTKKEAIETYEKYNALANAWKKMHEAEPEFTASLNAPIQAPLAKPVAVFTPLKLLVQEGDKIKRVDSSTLVEINPERYGDLKILLVKGQTNGRRIYQIAERHQQYTLDDYRHLARVAKEYGLNFTAAHLTIEKNRRALHEKMQDRLLSVYRAARGHAGLSISHPGNVFLDGKDFTGSIFFDTMSLAPATPKNKQFDLDILRSFDAILADTMRLPLDNRRRIEKHPIWAQAIKD